MESEVITHTQPPGTLLEEAALFSRYILARETTAEIQERYAQACRKLIVGGPRPEDSAALDFALRHPWSLPLLDAAAGLAAPESLLRKKLFLALAVLEATPEHADFFTPKPRSPLGVVGSLLSCGISSALKLSAGLPLLLGLRLFSGGASPGTTAKEP